jgi:hypothetical protein
MTPANLRLAASSVARVPSTRRSLRPCEPRFSAHASAESPLPLFADTRRPGGSGGSPMTLVERLDAVLLGVHDQGHAECPVCHGSMRRENGVARCGDCRAALA